MIPLESLNKSGTGDMLWRGRVALALPESTRKSGNPGNPEIH